MAANFASFLRYRQDRRRADGERRDNARRGRINGYTRTSGGTTSGYATDTTDATDATGYATDATDATDATGYATGYATDATDATDASGYATDASGYATDTSGYATDASHNGRGRRRRPSAVGLASGGAVQTIEQPLPPPLRKPVSLQNLLPRTDVRNTSIVHQTQQRPWEKPVEAELTYVPCTKTVCGSSAFNETLYQSTFDNDRLAYCGRMKNTFTDQEYDCYENDPPPADGVYQNLACPRKLERLQGFGGEWQSQLGYKQKKEPPPFQDVEYPEQRFYTGIGERADQRPELTQLVNRTVSLNLNSFRPDGQSTGRWEREGGAAGYMGHVKMRRDLPFVPGTARDNVEHLGQARMGVPGSAYDNPAAMPRPHMEPSANKTPGSLFSPAVSHASRVSAPHSVSLSAASVNDYKLNRNPGNRKQLRGHVGGVQLRTAVANPLRDTTEYRGETRGAESDRLEDARHVGNPHGVGFAANPLRDTAEYRGETRGAESDRLEDTRYVGNPHGVGFVANPLRDTTEYRGETRGAESDRLEDTRYVGNPHGVGFAANPLRDTAEYRGETRGAESDRLEDTRYVGNPHGVGFVANPLRDTTEYRGETRGAESDRLEDTRYVGNPHGVGFAANPLRDTTEYRGETRGAESDRLEDARHVGNPHGVGFVANPLRDTAEYRGETRGAESDRLEIARRVGVAKGINAPGMQHEAYASRVHATLARNRRSKGQRLAGLASGVASTGRQPLSATSLSAHTRTRATRKQANGHVAGAVVNNAHGRVNVEHHDTVKVVGRRGHMLRAAQYHHPVGSHAIQPAVTSNKRA